MNVGVPDSRSERQRTSRRRRSCTSGGPCAGTAQARSVLRSQAVLRPAALVSRRSPPPRRPPPLGVPWWALGFAEVARGLDTDGAGLSSAEAEARLRRDGPNTLQAKVFAASTAFGYAREYSAERAAEALSARVQLHATAIRDGAARAVPTHALVPGDLVVLSAGSIVPADLRVGVTGPGVLSGVTGPGVLSGDPAPPSRRTARPRLAGRQSRRSR